MLDEEIMVRSYEDGDNK
jgi:hypothetical protein